MFGRRSAAVLLILSLLAFQPACKTLLGDKSGSDGYGGVANRPAPHFKPGFNLFTPEQDIQMGRQSAQEVANQVPLLKDERILAYVRQLGARLAAKAPGYNFTYEFNVIATREINAFALPGGYVFVNAGAIAAARTEGELAGVMAHEISHVALRHPTNQVSKAYVAKTGMRIIRRVTGAEIGSILEQVGGAGANLLFLKFGRTAETQADLEGARIMADAGYDPRDMAGFFEVLQSKSGQRTPELMSDHPDPGNRVAAINRELPELRISSSATRDSNEFRQVKGLLAGGGTPLAQSAGPERKGTNDPEGNEAGTRPPAPSPNMRDFQARDGSFALQYPENWDALTSDDANNMIFAPQGAYGQIDEGLVVTHGIFIGTVQPQAGDLEAANSAFVQQQVNMNPDFRVARPAQAIDFGGRRGFATIVAGPSPVTGVVEIDVIYTTATKDGRLFYLITIAPEDEMKSYQQTFERIAASLRLAG
ncbi:MAG TPA: M48 family metallopeptidase [Pyrinomonadaceae bacterium]|nr:M48 family metallopeptidase [Pyrinomonadaceae bacterium]